MREAEEPATRRDVGAERIDREIRDRRHAPRGVAVDGEAADEAQSGTDDEDADDANVVSDAAISVTAK